MESIDIKSGSGSDSIVGGAGNDRIESKGAASGIDKLFGGAGNDFIGINHFDYSRTDSLASIDLDGGTGTDKLYWVSPYRAATTLVLNIANGIFKSDGIDLEIDGFEKLQVLHYEGSLNATGGDFADDIQGGTANDTVSGGGGNDILFTSLGDDSINGGAGNDKIRGFLGKDTLIGGSGNDLIDATDNGRPEDNDTISGGSGNDTFLINPGDKITDVSGTDTVIGSFFKTFDMRQYVYLENFFSGQNDGGVQTKITGNALNNRIGTKQFSPAIDANGGAGKDTLTGSNFGDTLEGGSGNDLIDGILDTSPDNPFFLDFAAYRTASSAVTVNLSVTKEQNTGGGGKDVIKNVEGLIGSRFADKLTGNDKTNTLEGGAGNDRLDGGRGSDTASYAGAAEGIKVTLAKLGVSQDTAGAGKDTLISIENLTGSNYADSLTGSGGANKLMGGAGKDSLSGGSGKDTLSGGRGDDVLTGGIGADQFLFYDIADRSKAGIDRITDFNVADDYFTINFFTTPRVFTAAEFNSVSFATDAQALAEFQTDDKVIYNKTTGSLFALQGFQVTAASDFKQFAVVKSGTDLTAGDFFTTF